MRFAILCTFRPGAIQETKALRGKHYQFLADKMGQIVEGGPLLGSDGLPTAMLMIVNQANLQDARDFIATEPYTHAGLFESVAIREWRLVLPEASPGYVAAELEKELLANKR